MHYKKTIPDFSFARNHVKDNYSLVKEKKEEERTKKQMAE